MKRNWTHLTATAVVLLFAAGALAISFTHVIELAHRYGVEGWQAWTAPFLIDGFMLLGRLGMSRRFDTATNRIGRRMLVAGALLSLAANVGVGVTVGQRVYGALVVIGFLVSEWYAGKLAPAPAVETDEERTAREAAERRSASAKQAAVTRAANRAKKAAAAKPARRTARATALAGSLTITGGRDDRPPDLGVGRERSQSLGGSLRSRRYATRGRSRPCRAPSAPTATDPGRAPPQ